MRMATGGVPLAYKLMSTALFALCKILYIVTLACWRWYDKQIKLLKLPADRLQRCIKMGSGGWAKDAHISETLTKSLITPANLDYMEVDDGPSDGARRVLHFAWMIVGHRFWSNAVRFRRVTDYTCGGGRTCLSLWGPIVGAHGAPVEVLGSLSQ